MLVAVISDKFYTREAAIHIEINQSCRKCGHTYDIMHNLENPHFVNDPLSVNAAIRRKGRSLSRSHYNIRIRIWIGNSIQGSQTSTLTLYIYIWPHGGGSHSLEHRLFAVPVRGHEAYGWIKKQDAVPEFGFLSLVS